MPGCRSRSDGHLALASCTRFSPNTVCPAAITGSIASGPKVFETAISVTSDGARAAARQAAAMSACTAARRERESTRSSMTRRWLARPASLLRLGQIDRLASGRVGGGRGGSERAHERARVLVQDLAVDVVGGVAGAVIAGIERAARRAAEHAGLLRRFRAAGAGVETDARKLLLPECGVVGAGTAGHALFGWQVVRAEFGHQLAAHQGAQAIGRIGGMLHEARE